MAFGQDHARHAEAGATAQDRADIVRVGDLVEHDDARDVVSFGRAHDVFEVGILEPFDEGAEPLVHGRARQQPVERLAAQDLDVGQAVGQRFGQRGDARADRRLDLAEKCYAQDLAVRIGEGGQHGMDAVEPHAVAARLGAAGIGRAAGRAVAMPGRMRPGRPNVAGRGGRAFGPEGPVGLAETVRLSESFGFPEAFGTGRALRLAEPLGAGRTLGLAGPLGPFGLGEALGAGAARGLGTESAFGTGLLAGMGAATAAGLVAPPVVPTTA